MKKLLISTFILLSLVSCGAITRDDIINQKLVIKDGKTKAPIENVSVRIDGAVVGTTDKKGIVHHSVHNPNSPESFTITISHPNYQDVSIDMIAKPGGGYVVGGVAFFLLGLVPGVVSLAVDGATGTWYTYKKSATLYMNPK